MKTILLTIAAAVATCGCLNSKPNVDIETRDKVNPIIGLPYVQVKAKAIEDNVIVEDIIDSGHTLASVIDMLKTREPASLFICTLLDKFERREVDVPIRYCGFKIQNEFVFGYGLDMDEYYRNLPFIATVDLEKYESPTG